MIQLIAGGADNEINSQPDDEIDRNKDRRKDQQHHRLKGNPGIEQVAPAIGGKQGQKMDQQRFADAPRFDLIKDRCPRLNKRQQVDGNDP